MRFILGFIGAVAVCAFTPIAGLAIEPGPLAGTCSPNERYEAAGHGIYGTSDACVPIVAASPTLPKLEPEDDYDPWDYSGIQLEMDEPEMLVESGVDSGKAYKLALPAGQQLNVFDKPNGNVIGGLEGGGDVSARYYYTADVNNVWAGVCGQNGACGWVSADYLFAVPPGRTSEGVYEVVADELQAFAEPNLGAVQLGSIYRSNRVIVLRIVDLAGEHWAEICRMESCAWVPAFYLSFVY